MPKRRTTEKTEVITLRLPEILKKKIERMAERNGTSVNYFIVNMIRKADPKMPFIESEDDEKWAKREIKRLQREMEEMKEKILEIIPEEVFDKEYRKLREKTEAKKPKRKG